MTGETSDPITSLDTRTIASGGWVFRIFIISLTVNTMRTLPAKGKTAYLYAV